MAPTRTTRSSSRRSSILKPPKPRQPLQNLNFTNSSNENSPTVTMPKVKRRVSFAEKKHVQEFCNSVEQGTVWHSTYEEHDLSNLKGPCISYKDFNESTHKENVKITTDHHNDLVSVNPETVDKCTTKKTNYRICFIPNEKVEQNLIQIDHEAVHKTASEETELLYKQPTEKEVLPDSSQKIFHSTTRETNESVLSLDLPVNSESYVHRRLTVLEDPDVNISSKIPNGQDSNGNNFKLNKMNSTSAMHTQMDFTEAISHNIYSSINHTEKKKIPEALQNSMFEFTEAVPTSIQLLKNMKSVQQHVDDLNPKRYKSPISDVDLETYPENTQNLNNLSMDMTMAVSTIPYNLQEKEMYPEHTQNFNNVSMEMTAAIPTRSSNLHKKETYMECTKNFNNVTMEMTAAVPTRPYNFQEKEMYPEHTQNFNNVSMEMTAAIPTRSSNLHKKETYMECTKNFNNVSMEMTAAVPTRPYNLQEKEMYPEHTQNFNNVSMEMTAAIPTGSSDWHKREKYMECTKNFNNASMEMTAAVPTKPFNLQEKEMYPEHTQNFNNVSMEMTSAIPTRSSNLHKKETYMECTKNFNNASMEMTAAVPTRPYNLQEKEMYPEHTQNFNNVSMEMTSAIPTRSSNLQKKETYMECTKNFNNASMEMTAAVPTRPYNVQEKEMYPEHTQNFNNVSMEMTAAIPTRSSNLQKKGTYMECTKNFNNASMEMTAAVSTRPYNLQEKEIYPVHTQNFNNVSMEMTAAIPTGSSDWHKREKYMECTKNLNNASMEMTAAVPTKPFNLQEKETYPERTQNFNNASMEMTTTIPTRLCNLQSDAYPEHTKNFKDFSMEMTAAVPTKLYGLQEKRLNNDEMTSIFHDVSMDVTEAVPKNVYPDRVQRDKIHDDILSLNTNKNDEKDTTCMNDKIAIENSRCLVNSHRTENFDKTVMYNNKGMEFTTAISTTLKTQSGNFDVESDRTRIFHNNSMATTAVVSRINETGTVLHTQSRNLHVESDKTRIFNDNSMAITAVVPPLNEMDVTQEKVENYEYNVNARDSHKTILFPTISMEMTEAMPPSECIPQREDAITNMSEITRTRLPENIENRSSTDSLNRSSIPDNVLRDITALVVPPLLDSSESSKERNCTMNHAEISEVKLVAEPSSSEVSSPVNIEASSHDSPVQDISASALNLDNTGAACATPNSASNDSLHIVTLHANHGECLPDKDAKDTVPYPRRTYTIKPLGTDHSFTDNVNEYSQSTETSNDIQNASSCQAQAFFEKNCTLFDKGLEELEAIKPPSFLCLDDSMEDVPVNTNCSREDPSLLKIVQDLPVETPKLDQQKVVDESRKEKSLEAQRLRLSFNDSGSTEVQEFECSSSTTNNNQNIFIYNDKIENQNMEQSVFDRNDFVEEKHLESDEVKLRSDSNTSNNAMEVELQKIDSQISLAANDVSIELDPFSSLVKKLRACAESNEIIWEVYHENIERKMLIAGFISCSLLIVIHLGDDYISGDQIIKDIKIISRLADDADNLIVMVHRIISENIDVRKLIDLYENVEDITSMLDYVSQEVKLAVSFMFELKRLEDLNLMAITQESVSFVSHTKKMDTILRVTVIIKPFEKIDSHDIDVHCILGSVREDEIKKLMKNIKKDHKFLRRFMNDVEDYIYLMEQSALATNVSY